MRQLALLLFCLFLAAPASANGKAWEGIYEGQIGTLPVLVLLAHPDGIGDEGRYAYRLKPYDLGLVLDAEGEILRFTETQKLGATKDDLKGSDKRFITGGWSLRIAADTAEGEWRDAAGKRRLPIKLKKVSGNEPARDSHAVVVAYHQRWAEQVSFKAAEAKQSFAQIRIGMAQGASFGISFPRLLTHPDVARLPKINAMLENEHRTAIAEARHCAEYLPRQKPEEMGKASAPRAETQFEVTFAAPNLLSLTESGSVFCGGAHPNNSISARNYDLAAVTPLFHRSDSEATALTADRLGRILDLATSEKRVAFNRFWWDRWMAAARKTLEKKTDDDVADCTDGSLNGEPMAERSAAFHFQPNGLAIRRTDYPHAMSVCLEQRFNPLLVPWNDLRPWLKPGQTLLKLL
jgi:hypothetical protein